MLKKLEKNSAVKWKKNRNNNQDLKIYVDRTLSNSRILKDLLFFHDCSKNLLFLCHLSCKKHIFRTPNEVAKMTNNAK